MQIADERVGGQAASPVPPPPAVVVAETTADLADSPAELVAATWKLYAVDAARPVTVAEVPETERTFVPPR